MVAPLGRIGVEPGVGALHGRVGPGAGNGQVQKMLGQVGASSTTTVPHPSVDRLPDDVNVWELVATVPPTGPSESHTATTARFGDVVMVVDPRGASGAVVGSSTPGVPVPLVHTASCNASPPSRTIRTCWSTPFLVVDQHRWPESVGVRRCAFVPVCVAELGKNWARTPADSYAGHRQTVNSIRYAIQDRTP